jgi:hypothetical protein
MSHPYLQSIRKQLWPSESGRDIWTILDGARERRIYGHVVDTYLESSCLYSGQLPPALEVAAPYLVQLEYDDRLTRRVIDEGWGHSWGIFLKSSASLKELRRHLRGFLMVLDPQHNRMVFRYYDPRVLRVYLPTCTADELQTFFGHIETFWTEAEDPATLLEFSLDSRKLVQKAIPLKAERAVTM